MTVLCPACDSQFIQTDLSNDPDVWGFAGFSVQPAAGEAADAEPEWSDPHRSALHTEAAQH